MTCRDEILDCVAMLERRTGRKCFAVSEIIEMLHAQGTTYPDSTIRTHIVSRICANAPKNHPVKYDDLERVERGMYRRHRH